MEDALALDSDGSAPLDAAKDADGNALTLECNDCCGGVCYRKYIPCPAVGQCVSSPPPIFLPCSATCSDGEPIGGRVVAIPGEPDLAGWCWAEDTNDPDCRKWTTEDPPPLGYCLIPDGSIIIDDGWECVGDCSDDACSRRGTYLIATVCAGQCGTENQMVLVCLDGELDLSQCWWLQPGDSNQDFCGCIVLGPQTREYTGDPTGWRIIYASPDQFYKSLDAQSACCECCGTKCQRCNYERIPLTGTTCIDGGAGRYCCCGQDKRVVAVVFGNSRFSRLQPSGRLTLLDRKNFSTVTVQWTWDGSRWDASCGGVSARETLLERVTLGDGTVEFERFQSNQADNCDEASVILGNEPCLTTGQDMAIWPGSGYIWPFAEPSAGFSNWGTTTGLLRELIDPDRFRCSGSTVFGCVGNQVCTGGWTAKGGCGSGTYSANIKRVSDDAGDTITEEATVRVFMYSVIDGWQPDCEGGCDRRTPREIGDGGSLGAGDIL